MITEEIRFIVVQCETARNSNRTIDVLVAGVMERRELAVCVSPKDFHIAAIDDMAAVSPNARVVSPASSRRGIPLRITF